LCRIYLSIKASYDYAQGTQRKAWKNRNNIHVTTLVVTFRLARLTVMVWCESFWICHIFNIKAPCFSGSGTKLYCEQSNFQLRLLFLLLWFDLNFDLRGFTNHWMKHFYADPRKDDWSDLQVFQFWDIEAIKKIFATSEENIS